MLTMKKRRIERSQMNWPSMKPNASAKYRGERNFSRT